MKKNKLLKLSAIILSLSLIACSGFNRFPNSGDNQPDSDFEKHEATGSHVWSGQEYYPNTSSTVSYTIHHCTCGAVKMTIDAGNDLNGNLTRGHKLPKGIEGHYDGTKPALYNFEVDMDGFVGTLYAFGGVDNPSFFDLSLYSGRIDGVTLKELPDGQTNTVFTLNGKQIELCKNNYGSYGISGVINTSNPDESKATLIKIGDVSLYKGLNTLEMAVYNSYGLIYFDLVFIGMPTL